MRTPRDLPAVPVDERRALSALPVLRPTGETWRAIDGRIDAAGDVGERFGVGDLRIAALARQAGGLVWSLDRGFVRRSRLGLVDSFEP